MFKQIYCAFTAQEVPARPAAIHRIVNGLQCVHFPCFQFSATRAVDFITHVITSRFDSFRKKRWTQSLAGVKHRILAIRPSLLRSPPRWVEWQIGALTPLLDDPVPEAGDMDIKFFSDLNYCGIEAVAMSLAHQPLHL